MANGFYSPEELQKLIRRVKEVPQVSNPNQNFINPPRTLDLEEPVISDEALIEQDALADEIAAVQRPEISGPNQNFINPNPEISNPNQNVINPNPEIGNPNQNFINPNPEVSNPYQNVINPNPPSDPRFSQHPLEGGNVRDPYQRMIEETFAKRDATPLGPKRDALNEILTDLRSPDAPLVKDNYAGYTGREAPAPKKEYSAPPISGADKPITKSYVQDAFESSSKRPGEVSNPNQNIINPNPEVANPNQNVVNPTPQVSNPNQNFVNPLEEVKAKVKEEVKETPKGEEVKVSEKVEEKPVGNTGLKALLDRAKNRRDEGRFNTDLLRGVDTISQGILGKKSDPNAFRYDKSADDDVNYYRKLLDKARDQKAKRDLELGKTKIKTAGDVKKAERKVLEQVKKDSLSLAKDYRNNKVTKNTEEILSAYKKIQTASKGGRGETGVKDISLVFSYMKMLDPTSVVREGEQATLTNASGVGDRWLNI